MRFSDWIKFLMWWLGGAFILIYQFPVLIKWLEVNQISTLAGPGILVFWIVIAPICIRFLIGQSTRCTNCRRSFAISKGRRIITGERQIWKREEQYQGVKNSVVIIRTMFRIIKSKESNIMSVTSVKTCTEKILRVNRSHRRASLHKSV